MGGGDAFCWFNGIDGSTGDYLLPPARAEELVRLAFGDRLQQRPDEQIDPSLRNKLRFFHERATEGHFGPKEGVDPTDLSQTGWGVIFPAAVDPASSAAQREALGPLLALRRERCGARYREYVGADAYRAGERADEFLARHGVGPGPAEPDKVPYHLLLVGGPDAIPYRFQYELDVQYAVGRIHFDTLDEVASYARSVVEAEQRRATLPRRVAFFGTQHPDDRATQISATELITPLSASMRGWIEEELIPPGWEVASVFREDATKARLAGLLGGAETPALLFTASHGMGFPARDPRLIPHQGALLCQDWPGPVKWGKSVPHDFYLAADDIGEDARPLGLIAFHFACYSAGTPLWSPFARRGAAREKVAPFPFLASLPRRLLGHGRGGALAVIGHVDRTLSCSFSWPNAGAQIATFESTLKRLLEGHTVGSAVECFNLRYAELATKLSSELDDVDSGAAPDPSRLLDLWTTNNDARSYVVLGDPAVRLCAGRP